MRVTVPPLRARVLPLMLFGWVISAIRLALDGFAPAASMFFGAYYLMPVALAYVGLTRRWGPISWRNMALTMLVLGFVVWGVWTTIAYTTGQFLEWEHGRFYPGEEVIAADGSVAYENARAAPVQEGAIAKIGAGLLHGLLSSLASTVWCTVFGTLLIWLPARGLRPAND